MRKKISVLYVLISFIAFGLLLLTLNRYRFYRNYIDIGKYAETRAEQSADPESASQSTQSKSSAVLPIDINSADIDSLVQLPGIGRETALQIIEYRNEHGKFTEVDGLIHVHGIGVKKLEKLRDCVIIR
jgi:competence protein ComEA